MKSIKVKLLQVFFAIIITLIIGSLCLFALNLQVIQQYKAITDIMTTEYRLVDTAFSLITAYNIRVQSAGTDIKDSDSRIQNAKTTIRNELGYLDKNITDTESLSNYLGFKYSLQELIDQIDESIEKINKNNIKDYVSDYNTVNKQYGFVRDNGSVLIFSELKYATSVRKAIDRNYLLSIIVGLSALSVLCVSCIFYVLRFSKNFIAPLSNLTLAAQKLASGNMDFIIDASILEQKNEIGTLASSFDTMKQNLHDKMFQLNETSEKLENNLKEVERMNALMVGRELKIIELKKKVHEPVQGDQSA
jgi:HAMP domain-containing protein